MNTALPDPHRGDTSPLRPELDGLRDDVDRLRDALAAAARTPDDVVAGPLVSDAMQAVDRARVAVGQAVTALADISSAGSSTAGGAEESIAVRWATSRYALRSGRALLARTAHEFGHVVGNRPYSVLIRVVITLAIALSMVAFYSLVGWSSYDETGSLSLYLFGAVVGSVVCTNALCFDASRIRADLASGERLWRILVAKNLTIAILVGVAAAPVITYLALTTDLNVASMIDQFAVMVFIWLGVGNLLSIISPLRQEPLSARLKDGTWRNYLMSFGISYGVGLTVNLMIYWRVWARKTAADQLSAPSWALQLLMLASGILAWVLLTVLAVSSARLPSIRDVLTREMVTFRRG